MSLYDFESHFRHEYYWHLSTLSQATDFAFDRGAAKRKDNGHEETTSRKRPAEEVGIQFVIIPDILVCSDGTFISHTGQAYAALTRVLCWNRSLH